MYETHALSEYFRTCILAKVNRAVERRVLNVKGSRIAGVGVFLNVKEVGVAATRILNSLSLNYDSLVGVLIATGSLLLLDKGNSRF